MIVLDASALLALIKGEEGEEVVARAAGSDDATISAVNYTETLQKAARAGVTVGDVDVALEALGITVSLFGRLDARLTASFYRHRSGLSLADRVCLALARSLSSVAFTADQAWENWADHADVATWVAQLRQRGSAPGTVRQAHRVLSLLLDLAVRDGRIPRNPAERMPLPRIVRGEPRFLTRDEVELLADAPVRTGTSSACWQIRGSASASSPRCASAGSTSCASA